jgi:FKBP-type peptidyl-prolyl cis-trans isomerase FkpA
MKRMTLFALAALTGSLLQAVTCYGQPAAPAKSANPAAPAKPAQPAAPAKPASPAAEVIKTDVRVGAGTEATAGKTVSVQYTGWLYDAGSAGHRGLQIDNSRERGQPYQFQLGAGQVMAGWDDGISGMKVGGERTLLIPGLAYGTVSAGGVAIPPNTPLLFDIELLDVR